MSGIRVEGNTSGNVAEVDTSGNLKVTLPTSIAQAGYDINIVEVDSGSITGTPLRRSPYVTQSRRLAVGLDTPIFDYTFNATAQDTGVWRYQAATMTATQSGGAVVFNNSNTLTATTGCSLSSWRYFQLLGGSPLRVSVTLQVTAAFLAGQIWESGLFVPTNTTQPADGVYFRYTNSGLVGVLNYAGVETTTGVLLLAMTPSSTVNFVISVGESSVEFWADLGNGTVLLGTQALPAAQSDPFSAVALPLTTQFRNGSTVSGSPVAQLKWTDANVIQRNLQLAMPYSQQMALQKGTGQGLSGGTQGSLASYANNVAAGAGAALSNTATLVTGLGGQASVLPTLTAGTDGIVCSYQNPVGTTTQTPRTFVCTGVKVQGGVTTLLSGGAVLYAYSLAYGHTAVSMATGEGASFSTSPTTKAPRRIPLGYETYASAAAVGTMGSVAGVTMTFTSPIIINPGEFIAVCAKNLGVVTSAGVITILVAYDGYWI